MKNLFLKLQAYLALRSKVSEADAMFRKTGERHFVVPVHGTLQVITVNEGLSLKKQGALPADFTAKTIYGASYYWSDTSNPHAAVKGPMAKFDFNRRKLHFYQWFFAIHS